MVLKRWGLQLLALVLVLGIGIPVQLNQLQRSWKLRRRDPAYRGESVLMPLRGGSYCCCCCWCWACSAPPSYLFVQALGLLQEPFSGVVLSSFPVLGSLPLPLVIGIAAALLVFLLRWPLTTLRISLSLAILASAIALARHGALAAGDFGVAFWSSRSRHGNRSQLHRAALTGLSARTERVDGSSIGGIERLFMAVP